MSQRLPVNDPEHDWRYRLRMVHAKAESSEVIASYQSQMFDLFENVFYSKAADPQTDILEQGFRFGVDDREAPHYAIPVFEDERYRLFDLERLEKMVLRQIAADYFVLSFDGESTDDQ